MKLEEIAIKLQEVASKTVFKTNNEFTVKQ